MAEFDDDMLLGQLRDLLRNRSTGSTPRSKHDEFKANDLPEFAGGTDPEVYLDWERQIERLFDFKELTDEKRCKYAILRLSKGASLWYEGEKKKRTRAGKEKITSWESLKRKLRKRYVPNTHQITTYRKIAELRQGKASIGEYIDEFEGLSLMGEIEEIEEQKMARFLRGMNPSIAHSVELYPYTDFDTLCSLSTKVEAQGKTKFGGGATAESGLTNPWARYSPMPSVQAGGSSDSMKTPNQTSSATAKPTEASKETSLSKMRCFKCQGFGHLQHSCPNKRIVTLREAISWEGFQSAEEQDDQVFGSKEEDEDIEEFEAPPNNTNLMLRAQQGNVDTDDPEQHSKHSGMTWWIGEKEVEQTLEGDSGGLQIGNCIPEPEGRPSTPSDGCLTIKATNFYSEAEATEASRGIASRRITLQNPNGSNWQVEISETINGNFLSAGRSNFVEDHSLKEHEFLVFRCIGNMHFNVMILDTSAYERQDLFEMKIPKSPAYSLPFSSTYPYFPQQSRQEVIGFNEENDLTALNDLSLRSFGFCPPSADYLRLSTFLPSIVGFSSEFRFGFGRLCENREVRNDRDKARRRTEKLLFEERKEGEQERGAIMPYCADERPGFKEEPPPSGPFGSRRVRSSADSSVAFGHLRVSTASGIGFRSSVFVRLRLTPGDYAPPTFNASDLMSYFNDDRPELRTIPFKGEEMMRIWNVAPENPHVMIGRMASKRYKSRLLVRLAPYASDRARRNNQVFVRSHPLSALSTASKIFFRPCFPSTAWRPSVFVFLLQSEFSFGRQLHSLVRFPRPDAFGCLRSVRASSASAFGSRLRFSVDLVNFLF